MILNEIQCYSILYNGTQWFAMIFNDIQWFPMIHNDLQWYTMIFIDIHWCTCLGLGAFDVGAQFLFKIVSSMCNGPFQRAASWLGLSSHKSQICFSRLLRECGKPNDKLGDGWCIIGFTWVYCSMYIDGTIKQPFANHFKLWFIISSSLRLSAGDRWIW